MTRGSDNTYVHDDVCFALRSWVSWKVRACTRKIVFSMFLTRGVRILCVRLLVVSLAVPLKVGLGAWSVDVMLPLDLNEIAYGETGVSI